MEETQHDPMDIWPRKRARLTGRNATKERPSDTKAETAPDETNA